MKRFFKINTEYQFEWNDFVSVMTVINVILIIIHGLIISWLGLTIAGMGIARDLIIDRRINLLFIHLATAILNIYFLLLFYKII